MQDKKTLRQYAKSKADTERFLQKLLDNFSPGEAEQILLDLVEQVKENA